MKNIDLVSKQRLIALHEQDIAKRQAKANEDRLLKELAVHYEKQAIASDRMHNLDRGFHYWLMLDTINRILAGNPALTENTFPVNPENK